MTAFERFARFMLQPVILFLVLGLFVVCYLYVDIPVAYYFHNMDLHSRDPAIVWVTNLGLGAIYFAGFFILALWCRYIMPSAIWEARWWFLWLCAVIPSAICFILKILLGRARPQLLFSDGYYGFYGLRLHDHAWHWWSCPSGHTSVIMGVMFGLCVLFPRYMWLFIGSGLCVAISRILLTDHYVSDVLVTSYLTLLEVVALVYVIRRSTRFSKILTAPV